MIEIVLILVEGVSKIIGSLGKPSHPVTHEAEKSGNIVNGEQSIYRASKQPPATAG